MKYLKNPANFNRRNRFFCVIWESHQLWVVLLSTTIFLAPACGGDEPTPTTKFNCIEVSPADPDQIAMLCPANTEVMLSVDIVIDGPTTSSDIYGVRFDLVFDDTILAFEPPGIEGSFLNKNGGPTILQAGTEVGNSGRLVVAISLQGNVNGVQATAPREVVMTLGFRGVNAGNSTLAFENFEVVDSNLTPIGSLHSVVPYLLP